MAAKDGKNLPTPEGMPPEAPWAPEALEKFVKGEITLGELEGVDKQSQYKVAHIGHGLLSQGKLDEAAQVFHGLLALDPKDPYFLLACGAVAQQQDKLEEAEQFYTRCLEIEPKHPVARANRGEVRVMLERIEDAAEDLVEAVKADPQAKHPTTQRAKALLVEIKKQLDAVAH